ncbi:uncharacterized protein HD556DRAFT_1311972 [Suillus plorans]|uniref:Uncharacterized protein n=1 Tax=Suillus plorans TaxID=116603 RepID=A0A9P7AFS7_9AGAM|nr:uncharacterized protein HD556DRAFT_1311972 [Suillus plorans]KAG1788558.1 hypothetical protein HD556DRAFT_1311972 [Suillus plorans]
MPIEYLNLNEVATFSQSHAFVGKSDYLLSFHPSPSEYDYEKEERLEPKYQKQTGIFEHREQWSSGLSARVWVERELLPRSAAVVRPWFGPWFHILDGPNRNEVRTFPNRSEPRTELSSRYRRGTPMLTSTSTSTSPPMVMSTSGILKIRIVFESDARIPHPRLSEDAQDLLFACPRFPGDARDLLFACFTHKGSKPHQDAKDIVFYNDPDDIIPLGTPSSAQPTLSTTPTGSDAFSVLLKAGRKPAPVTAGARRSIRTFKPSARLCDADNACSHPSSSNSSTARKRALSSATERLVSKKVALQLSAPLSDDD